MNSLLSSPNALLLRDVLMLLLPNIVGGAMGLICSVDVESQRVSTKSQPPGWVFGVVWPTLYLLLGVSLLRSINNRTRFAGHLILIALLNAWVYVAGCQDDYKLGAWIFVLINGITIWLISTGDTNTDKTLSIPLLAWLLFAHQLNVHIVEKL